MPPRQRRLGLDAIFKPTIVITDRRGDEVRIADEDPSHWIKTKCWMITNTNRTSRAEVPGQLEIDSYKIGIKADIPGIDLWSRVIIDGEEYDVLTPPYRYNGTKQVRHWSLMIRQRPDSPHTEGDG